MSKWIIAKDKMPERGEPVIGYDSFYEQVGEARLASWSGRLVFVDSDDCNIVLWQAMPEPPTREEVAEALGDDALLDPFDYDHKDA